MGMSLNSGGHLTHGAKPTFSGKYFDVKQYEVDPETYLINYDELEKQILENKPRLFIAGASAYPREIQFHRIRESIDKLNNEILNNIKQDYENLEDNDKTEDYIDKRYEKEKCYYMVDMAHIAGLVAAKLQNDPLPYADVVTSTTHKTLRGPRGGIILTNDEKIANMIDKAVFPGIQGGPLENMIIAKAVAFGEALKPEFAEYQNQVKKNAYTLAETLKSNGIDLVSGGTDNHLILIDLRNTDISGLELEETLAKVGIIANKNAIPFDTKNKKTTSGLRIGTPAVTTRGLREPEMIVIGYVIANLIHKTMTIENAKKEIDNIIKRFPLDKILNN